MIPIGYVLSVFVCQPHLFTGIKLLSKLASVIDYYPLTFSKTDDSWLVYEVVTDHCVTSIPDATRLFSHIYDGMLLLMRSDGPGRMINDVLPLSQTPRWQGDSRLVRTRPSFVNSAFLSFLCVQYVSFLITLVCVCVYVCVSVCVCEYVCQSM